MRFLILIVAALALAQCATPEDRPFRVGQSQTALVVIGVAEAAENTDARYTMLWRLLDSSGDFTELAARTAFEARTNESGSARVRGIPGEFALIEVEPGVYALDSVFALIRDRRVDYVANGVISGPERPAVEVRPGQAVYLGIWQMDLEDARAVARPWRLSEADLRAVLAQSGRVEGHVRVQATQTRSVPCAPRPVNSRTSRQVC
jgi:hypothetical protein